MKMPKKRFAMTPACLLAGLALQAQAQVPVPSTDLTDEVLDTVLVTGEQPRPALWKVSNGGNVLWILGSNGSIPGNMPELAQQAEARIRESKEVLYRGNAQIGADINILYALTLLPTALKATKVPDGKTLKDVLPAETYARWRVLKQKYVGRDDDIEEWRPAFALPKLVSAAVKKTLASLPKPPPPPGKPVPQAPPVVVEKLAKKHKVRIHRLPEVERKVKIEKPRQLLKSVRNVGLPDLDCFTRGVDSLEPFLEYFKAMVTRDEQKLLEWKDKPPPKLLGCEEPMSTALENGEIAGLERGTRAIADFRRLSAEVDRELERNWLDAAQDALSRNRSTFAVLQMPQVRGAASYPEILRALGYTVEKPF
jgi:hypothetical protein